jgi:hypothetical protein
VEDWENRAWFDALKEREGADAAQTWIVAESVRDEFVNRAWGKDRRQSRLHRSNAQSIELRHDPRPNTKF